MPSKTRTRKIKELEVGSVSLVIEVSQPMDRLLMALQNTGLWGPSKETVAQRILEQWMFKYVTGEPPAPKKGKK